MKFHHKRILLGVIVAAAVVAFFVSSEGRRIINIIPSVPQASAAHGYGFSTSFDGLGTDQADQKLHDIKASGANWVRLDLSWNGVQHDGPEKFDWSAYDKLAELAAKQHLGVIMILDLAPSWARPAGCDSELCGPSDKAAYANFAGAAARHFAPKGVHTWEIWNEPNISFRFRPSANAQAYVELLKSASSAIRKADSRAFVLAGAMAPSATNAANYSPADFVKAIYAGGGGGSFDAISTHPYTFPITPSKSTAFDSWGQIQTIHNIMATHGEGYKAVWITEFGAPTNGPIANEKVTEAVQAQIIAEGIKSFRSHPWAGPMLFYDFKDAGTSSNTSENFYGLLRGDGSQKPAYQAFQSGIIAFP